MIMQPGQVVQPEYIFEHVAVGVAILGANDLRIHYMNPYLRSLLEEPWSYQEVIGECVDKVIPVGMLKIALPPLQQVAATGQRIQYAEVPYEGFLETQGRTYWRIAIERMPTPPEPEPGREGQEASPTLLITIEGVTEAVRAKIYLNAIHHISAVIAGPTALPQVLDRILQAIQELVGAKRCAVILADQSSPDTHISEDEESQPIPVEPARIARIVAYKGLHSRPQDWHPPVTERTLVGQAENAGHALIITDTGLTPEMDLPLLDDEGAATRPGSVLCVPIFEPYHVVDNRAIANDTPDTLRTNIVLGTIEVYHRRARGYATEEVQLLERFAQQAGLAIHNARLFRSVDQWARAASRQAHQRTNMMQAIPDGVVIYDPRWRVADANHAARQLFGWKADIIGKPVAQALAQSNTTLQADFMNAPNLAGELERRALEEQIDEFKIASDHGQISTQRCSYTPIRDDFGDIFAFILVYHDVTEEVAARERIEAQVIARTAELAQRNKALQQAKAAQELTNARLGLLLERLPSGVILVNAQNNAITIINQHAVQLLNRMGAGLEPQDDLEEAVKCCIGMNGEVIFRAIQLYGVSGAPMPYEERPLYRALKIGEASEAEMHANSLEGQTLHLLANAAPLRTADGAVSSAVLVLHDISAMKTLERAREDFFTTMAHELKTPLANIRAHLSALLARDLQWSLEEQYDFLQTADEQVERLVGMINHFLDASRVEAGALRLELEPILLPEMLEDLQDRLEALITNSKRQLKIEQPTHPPAVLGDYELIMSVLTNLLSNAFRYAPEGDIVLLEVKTIFDKAGQTAKGVTLSVTDRGPGMTSERQKEVFMRFSTFAAMSRPAMDRPGQPAAERQRGTARWSPATGLGLYISRGIIEAHGSQLMLKSSPGQGASFAFTLPVYDARKRGRQEKSNQKGKEVRS
jgi:PAS domain S-box-containing protein